MARYFFHIVNGQFFPDSEGTECATADEVKAQAVIAAGEALQDQGFAFWHTGRWYMFVTDAGNNTKLKFSFEAEDLTGELSAPPPAPGGRR
jgi:hypothetical protein